MEKERKDMLYSLIVALVVLGVAVICWLKPADEFSKTERRKLDQFPTLSWETVSSGKFMEEFEGYTSDQFPFRDAFRSAKAIFHKYVLGQLDNHEVYIVEDTISEMDATLSQRALDKAIKKFSSIYEMYMKDTDSKVYLSVIPDKNYFIADRNGYLSYDYDGLYEYVQKNMPFASYIEIRDLLSIEDYYRTDSHWKQENILKVAERLAAQMGTSLEGAWSKTTLETPFYGVYYGQLALPVDPDTITYMDNSLFADCIVYDHESQKEIPVYDMELAVGRDAYEMFLSGAKSVITIENPNASSGKELVVFRDSFGSSLSPLLISGYEKITLLDIRYLNEKMIGEFVEFSNQDVLFLYSTSVLNNESSFR